MSQEEAIYEAIRTRLEKYDYKSANFKLALVKENDLWKIAICRIILDISEPKRLEADYKQNSFALENFLISIDEFTKFLEYLKHVYVKNVTITNNTLNLTEDLFFKLGEYKLCFVGNFPSRELYFYGREVARTNHGIDKPIYHTDYAIHGTAASQLRYQTEMIGSEIPFRNVIEAINHYWHTNYQPYSLPSSSSISFPNYDASILNCIIEKNHVQVQFDIDTDRVKINELVAGIIFESEDKNYRKNHVLSDKMLHVYLDFEPEYGTLYLTRNNNEKMDELNYQSVRYKASFENIGAAEQSFPRIVGINNLEEPIVDSEERIFSYDFVRLLPTQIKSLVDEADVAYANELYRATAILLRTVVEEGITLVLKRSGRDTDLYDTRKYEVGLQKKIDLCNSNIPELRQITKDLEDIKWFGDNATHEPAMPIIKRDIINLEPRFRLFLTKLAELLKQP